MTHREVRSTSECQCSPITSTLSKGSDTRDATGDLFLSGKTILVYHVPDTLFQMRHVEVDDESNRPATELEVGKHLRRVQREKLFDRLQFDNDAILDEKIDPVPGIKDDGVINHRKDAPGAETASRAT